MQDYIIVVVLLVVLLFAIFRAKKHFKGGGCFGSNA